MSCEYLFLPSGRLAAEANGKVGLSCDPEPSFSSVPSPSSNVERSLRCCLKRGGRLNSWLRCAGWSVSEMDDELEDGEAGISGDSAWSIR